MSEISKAYEDYFRNKKARAEKRAKLYELIKSEPMTSAEKRLLWSKVDKVKK